MGTRRVLREFAVTAREGRPTFSVCIPTYNGADYLGEAIQSVLGQGFGAFELVICDDASTDATPHMVTALDDARIRYLRFDQRLGQSGNFNRCIEASRGELWTLLSADDRLRPQFLKRAHEALARHPEAGFFVSAYERIDAKGNPLGEKRAWHAKRVVAAGELLDELLLGAQFNTLGLVVRRPALTRLGSFRTDVRWSHDWDWALRLVAHEGGVYTPEALAEYREHEASGTADALRAGGNGAEELRVLREALDRLPREDKSRLSTRSLRAFAVRQLFFSEMAIGLGSRSAALANLRHAVRATPWILSRLTLWKLVWRTLAGGIAETQTAV